MGVVCKNHRITTMNADRGGRFLATGSGSDIRVWRRDDKGAPSSSWLPQPGQLRSIVCRKLEDLPLPRGAAVVAGQRSRGSGNNRLALAGRSWKVLAGIIQVPWREVGPSHCLTHEGALNLLPLEFGMLRDASSLEQCSTLQPPCEQKALVISIIIDCIAQQRDDRSLSRQVLFVCCYEGWY